MSTSAENLRDLHALHQRSKSLRDRLASGPKTLAARQTFLNKKKTELDSSREALKKIRVEIKNKENQVQSQRDRADDLRTKLNAVKKQTEYDAIRNEISHTNQNASKLEDEVLELMQKVEGQETEIKGFEAEVAKITQEVQALAKEIEDRANAAQSQLAELDAAIAKAEEIIPEDQREQYVRNIKGRADDAMAQVDDGACHGCFVAVTPQMVNELINGTHLVFCKTCGRILYLAEQPTHNLRKATSRA